MDASAPAYPCGSPTATVAEQPPSRQRTMAGVGGRTLLGSASYVLARTKMFGGRIRLLAVLLWILVAEVMSRSIGTERYEVVYIIQDILHPKDKSFPSRNLVFNQTVTCGEFTPGKFVAPTYTCADIRVDGFRLAYGYYFGWSVGQEYQRCQETYGVHEFAMLCQMLLKSIGMEKLGFKAAYIPKSTCSFMNETRKLLKKLSDTEFVWTDFKPGWGWTETIQCMTDNANV